MSELAETTPPALSPSTNASAAVRPKQAFSVAVKLALIVGFNVALLLAGLLTGSWFYWQKVLRNQVDAQLSAVAASRRDMVEAQVFRLLQRIVVDTDRGELRGLLQELRNGTPETMNRLWAQNTLNHIADAQPLLSASLADLNGQIVLSSNPAEVGMNVKRRSEFQAGQHEPHLGWPRLVNDRYEATVSAPIKTRANPKITYGVLIATVDVSPLAVALADTTGLGNTGEAVLGVRTDQHFRFLFPPRNAPETSLVPLGSTPALAAAAEGVSSFFHTRDYRGIPVLAASQPIQYRGWGLVVKMDEFEAYAPVRRALRVGVLSGLAVLAFGLLAAFLLARSFTQPVRQLAQAAERVSQGDYESRVPVASSDEFGRLSASFNQMTAALRARSTERDQAEAALRDADRRKDEFLAMLGHELRNPLSAISHAARLWQEDESSVAMARGVIIRQSGNLVRLVDDLLDVVRITAGKIELRRRPVHVAAAVREAVEAIRPLLEDRRHEFDLSHLGSEQTRVDADPTRFEQVLQNLLTNAAKYTPDHGRIVVNTRTEGDQVLITVSDNGIGIAPEILPRIFELFAQADRSLDRTSGGLGIGLTLCRQLVELHGGTLTAHSPGAGQGSSFVICLPILAEVAPSEIPAVPRNRIGHSARRRILLVDDNEDTVRSLSRLLTLRGHEVATAYDGLTALRIADEAQPEVFLLDIGLPGLDGYELARRLRAAGFPLAQIIAISGYAQESDRARARSAGFNHHFAKPVDFEELAALIAEEVVR